MISQLIVKCFCFVFYLFSFFALIAFPVYALSRKDKWSCGKAFPQIVCSWCCLLALSVCAVCSDSEYQAFISSCAGFIVSGTVMAEMLPHRLPCMIAASLVSILAFIVRLFCPDYAVVGKYSWIFVVLVLSVAAVAVHSDLKVRSQACVLPRNRLLKGKNEAEYSFLVLLVTAALVTVSSSAGRGSNPAGNLLPPFCLMAHTALFMLRSVELLSGERLLYKDAGPDPSCGIANLCREPNQEDCDDVYSMEIYDRLLQYFDEEKPYLNPEMNIAEVAKNIFTNKVYLSKAVNACTGRNFCQFVNYYRIRYALDLFISDPAMKITHIARMSGFNTFPTFNLAFRLYMNETPRDWCRRYIQEHGLSEDEK